MNGASNSGGGIVMDRSSTSSLKKRCASPSPSPPNTTTTATTTATMTVATASAIKKKRLRSESMEIAGPPMSAVIEESSDGSKEEEECTPPVAASSTCSVSPGGSADHLTETNTSSRSHHNCGTTTTTVLLQNGEQQGEPSQKSSSSQQRSPTIITNAQIASAKLPATMNTLDNIVDRTEGGGGGIVEEEEPLPLKSTLYCHLRRKYTADLSYMLVEFQKLERQLLGAGAQSTAGSIERREKLRSFIQHLEETIQQIADNCTLEEEHHDKKKHETNAHTAATAITTIDSSSSTTSTGGGESSPDQNKVHEENVQKLEEHILGSLLPVKDRLRKQLAAQQGAKHNPVGIGGPVPRDTVKPTFLQKHTTTTTTHTAEPSTATTTTTTIPGRSLTQKLHGTLATTSAVSSSAATTMISKKTTTTTAIAKPKQPVLMLPPSSSSSSSSVPKEPPLPIISTTVTTTTSCTDSSTPPKILYAGLALGSTQFKSSLHAAGSAHNIIVQHPTLLELSSELHDMDALTTNSGDTLTKLEQHFPLDGLDDDDDDDPNPLGGGGDSGGICSDEAALLSATAQAAITSYEQQRRKWRRRRRRRKNLRRKTAAAAVAAAAVFQQQQQQQQQQKLPAVIKHKRGPRKVEYTCALCNETYNSTCEGNPWWALTQEDCAKCHKSQIPKVDIGAPANAIEYHPALLAHADDSATTVSAAPFAETDIKPESDCSFSEGSMSGSDVEDEDDDIGDDDEDDDDDNGEEESMFSSDDDDDCYEDFVTMSPGDRAENEKFGLEYEGPKLNDKDARKLLSLMLHASACPCRHESAKAEEVCRSTKWMMLHVRDCPGTTIMDDICPFPWCRKVKHLLYHLVSCTLPQECPICSGSELDYSWSRLRHLNTFRMKQAREKLIQGFVERDSQQQQKQWNAAGMRPSLVAGTNNTGVNLQTLVVDNNIPTCAGAANTAGSSPGAVSLPTSDICQNLEASPYADGITIMTLTHQHSESDLTVKFDCDPEMMNGSHCGFVAGETTPNGSIRHSSPTENGAALVIIPVAPTSG